MSNNNFISKNIKKLNKITLKKLNINESDILHKSDFKNIFGGYGNDGYSSSYGGGKTLYCIHEYSGGIRQTECFMSLDTANAFCDFYNAAGFNCRCYSC